MPYKDTLVRKAAQKAWYERNKIDVKRKAREKRNLRDQYVRDYKLENSFCTDCKVSYPPHMLDFDHVRGVKKFGINQGVRNKTLTEVIHEIQKCEIVCSNCHRHRTYVRGPKKKSVV